MPPDDDRTATPAARVAAPPLLRRRWVRWAIAVDVAIVLVIAALYLGVPPFLKSKLQTSLTQALERKTTIDAVAFNPFTLTATVNGVRIDNREGETAFVTIGELIANLSSESAWRWAPVVDALTLKKPVVNVARNDKGTYNFQDLLDRVLAGPGGPPPGFSVNSIRIDDGTITFDDRMLRKTHRIDGIDIGVPFLSSLPSDTEVNVAPTLRAKVNGTAVSLTGETTPFATSRRATLNFDVDRLALATYFDYLPPDLPVKVASGELTTRFKLTFVAGDAKSRELWVSGGFSLTSLAVQARDGTPLLSVPAMGFGLEKLDLNARTAEVGQIAFERPEIDLRRRADGSFELAGITAPAATSTASPSATPPWRIKLREARVAGGIARVSDASTAPAFNAVLSEIAATASELGNDPSDRGKVTLAFKTDLGGSVDADAEVVLASTFSARGKMAATGIQLKRLFPYYASALNLEVADGTLDLATTFAIAPSASATGVTMTDGTAALHSLALNFPGEKDPLWRVPEISASGVGVDIDRQSVTIEQFAGKRAVAKLRRDAQGNLDWARLLRTAPTTGTPAAVAPKSAGVPVPAPQGPPPSPPLASASPAEPTWQLSIRRAALEKCALDFEDRQPGKPVLLRFTEIDARGENYSNGRNKQGTLELATRVGSGGRLAVSGALGTNPFAAKWKLSASGLALPPLQPYIAAQVNAILTGGAVGANGTLTVAVSDAGDVRASYVGDAAISDFSSLDQPTSSDLLKWKALKLAGVDYTLAPFKLGIATLSADELFARLIVYPDGTINLTQLFVDPKAKAIAAGPPAPDAATATPSAASAPPAGAGASPERRELPVTVGRIDIGRGNVQYSDYFIKPNYSANLTDLVGTVSAMSPTQAGDLEIAAKLDHTAPVEIRGRIQPFAKELDLDLRGKARDIELPPLTMYAAKYAGYAIEKGKLTFDVHYVLANRKLTAQNKVVLDQLTFGERVESPSAVKLPVLLAVALLKDRHGVIDIDLPISGSIDDPQFSVGGLIIKVILNLIGKAVTAPFALLGAAFAGSSGETAHVEFAPGRAEIAPAAQTKVAALAKALADKPQVKLEIVGRYDPATDAPALKRAAIDRAVKSAKRRALVAEGTTPPDLDAIVVTVEEYPRYLEAAYKDAPFEKPKNAIGLEKGLPPAEMEAALLEHADASDQALRELANARALAVKQAIEKNADVADARLFPPAPKAGADAAKDGTKATRVDFALR